MGDQVVESAAINCPLGLSEWVGSNIKFAMITIFCQHHTRADFKIEINAHNLHNFGGFRER